MNHESLEASLNEGHAWVAHTEQPDQDDRRVGVTVALIKLPKGTFQVGIDIYVVEGPYGTDISWDHHTFESISTALEFIETSVGIKPGMFKKD